MTFGQRFQPGSGVRKLCMPTSVAVARSGEIFIADGYCNSRVLKFDHRGELIRIFPQVWGVLSGQLIYITERGIIFIIEDFLFHRVLKPTSASQLGFDGTIRFIMYRRS